MALPKKLKNWNAFINGVGFAGRATEMALPKIARKMEEYRAAGMAGPVEIDMGQEKLEVQVTLAEYTKDLLKLYGTTIEGVGLRFVGPAVNDSTNETDAIEITMRGRFKEMDFGTAKVGDNTELKLSAPLTYYKYKVNGEDLIEIDMINAILKVGGVDLMEKQRQALSM